MEKSKAAQQNQGNDPGATFNNPLELGKDIAQEAFE
jgi:hypothetical protein